MPFATDRDLLILEPTLFADVQWAAQRVAAAASASIAGTTLSASGADFAAQGVEPGMVALVDGVPVEVLARLSATTLAVSRPRAGLDDPAAPPPPISSKPLTIHTFRPQLEIVHAQVLAILGVEPEAEAMILNPRSLRLVEALGTLHLIFTSAALGRVGGDAGDSTFIARAELHRRRYTHARQLTRALLDTDGDGVADAQRPLVSGAMVRA